MNFTQHFKSARQVSTPLICVRTPDPASTVRNLSVAAYELAKDTKAKEPPVLLWDVGHGLKGFNDRGKAETARLLQGQPSTLGSVPGGAPPAFLRVIEGAIDDTLIFMSNAHRFWVNELVSQLIWNLRDVFKQKGQTLVLMTTMGAILPTELSNDILLLDEPLPTEEKLAEIVNDTFGAADAKAPKPELISKATAALLGLPYYTAEQQCAMSLTPQGLNLSDLWERKRQAIEQIHGLTVARETMRFDDIGGLTHAKDFFTRLGNGPRRPDGIVFTDELEKMFAGFGTDSSGTTTKIVGTVLTYMEDHRIRGSLFYGARGSGKTALGRAIGNELGILTINANFPAMESKYIGESTEHVGQALAVITAMFKHPLFIGTCNTWGVMPPELRRRYFLPTFMFDLPTPEERKLIWPIHVKAFGLKDQALPEEAELNHWTGAEIRNCCSNAHDLNCTLVEAASYIVPVSISDADGLAKMRKDANNKFISTSRPGLYQYDGSEPSITTTPRRRLGKIMPADIHDSA